MSESIERELAALRVEVAFWREFIDATIRRLAITETVHLIAVQDLALRRLSVLERTLSHYEESAGTEGGGDEDYPNGS